jgi:hypothetical protein
MAEKKSFLMYESDKVLLEDLTFEQIGYFTTIIMEYLSTHKLPEVINDPLVRMAVKIKTAQMDRDGEKYSEACERKSKAMKKRWNKNTIEDYPEDNTKDSKNRTLYNSKNSKNTIEQVEHYSNLYNSTLDSKADAEDSKVEDYSNLYNTIEQVEHYRVNSDNENDYENENENENENVNEKDNENEGLSANAEMNPVVYNPPLRKNHFQAEGIVAMYNNICTGLPPVQRATEDRLIAVEKLLNHGFKPTDIQRAFEKAQKSDFLKTGNGGNWRASFDWIIQENNLAKVLEGNYDNKNPPDKSKTEEIEHDLDKYRELINRF